MFINTLADGDSMDKKFACKYCGNDLREDDLFCPYCGHKAEIVIPRSEDSVFCTECGEKNSVHESFCCFCGAKLNPDHVELEEEVASVDSIDVWEGDFPAIEEHTNNTTIPVRNVPLSNKPKNKALFDKVTDIKYDFSIADHEKRPPKTMDASTADPYEGTSDSCDEYEEYEVGRINRLYKWIWTICMCAALMIIFWPEISAFFTGENYQSVTAGQDYGNVDSERILESTVSPIRISMPTNAITMAPTAIPVGSVDINVTPAKSENGTMVVAYEEDFQLSWYASNAYCYNVSLEGSSGTITEQNTFQTSFNITAGNLSIGSYVFSVTAYNSSGIAGAAEKLCFDIVSANTYIELSDYLGTSLYSFASIIDGMREMAAAEGVDYSNGMVEAFSPFDLDCIAIIGLEQSSNYSICGVSVGQNLEEASNILSDAGWWIVATSDTQRDYQDSEGNAIFIWSENGSTVERISIFMSDDTLADLYPSYFDNDDDSAYAEDIVMITTGDVNIRKGPGTDYSSVGVIKADTVVAYHGNSIIDEGGVVWYNILYHGIDGWISSKYVELLD